MTSPGQPLRVGLDVVVPDPDAYAATVRALVDDGVAGRIAAQDPTLWGPAARAEAAKRLSWTGSSTASRPLVAEIEALRSELADRGVHRVVLCGMGGSSLAPEVICAAAGVELDVVDSSAPDFVRSALVRLAETVVVVSSKSGSTVETDSQKRAFEQAFTDAGLDPADHLVVVTDPGSPLEEAATADGYRVFRADPDVGGRYSALTAFGLVPSGLAGVDIAQLLDQAEHVRPALEADDADNPALGLGALLGQAASAGADKLVLVDAGSPHPGLGDWIEQLVAESTGKEGTGLLPVVVEGSDAPNASPALPDGVIVSYGPPALPNSTQPVESGSDAYRSVAQFAGTVDAPLGAQFLLWEYATAVAGRLLGINPFDQPDVESAKAAARELLDSPGGAAEPVFTDGDVSVHAAGDWMPAGTDTVVAAVDALLSRLDPDTGYLAVQAYLDRHRDAALEEVRAGLARRTGRAVTFGWGPRFLHSTGQYHKGGPPTGVFLQVTAEPVEDLPVPGRSFSFQDFLLSQAAGDARVLADKGRPVLRLHLSDAREGVAHLRTLLG